MPSNTSSGAALNIGSLPYSITQDPGGAGVDLWYLYQPSSDQYVSVLGWVPAAQTYQPLLYIFSPDAVTTVASGIGSKPFLWKLIGGQNYYFKLDFGGSYTPGNEVQFSVVAAPTGTPQPGDLLIPNDQANFPATVISQTDGSVVTHLDLPRGENGAVLPDGTIALENGADAGQVLIYDKTGTTLIATVTTASVTGGGRPKFATDGASIFYVGQSQPLSTNVATVKTVSATGDVGVTSWTLPANSASLLLIAAARDRTILYYATGVVGSVVHRYDLENSVAVSDVGTPDGAMAPYGGNMYVLEDESLLVSFQNPSLPRYVVRHYARSGALLLEYDFGSDFLDHFVPTEDEESFWAWLQIDSHINRFKRIRISDGAVLQTLPDSEMFNSGLGPESDDGNPQRFGASDSCPLLLLRTAEEPIIDESLPCCEANEIGHPCDCSSSGGPSSGSVPTGSTSSQPPSTSTGPTMPPETPLGPVNLLSDAYWDSVCEGGGEVPTAADPVDAENWVTV